LDSPFNQYLHSGRDRDWIILQVEYFVQTVMIRLYCSSRHLWCYLDLLYLVNVSTLVC